MGCTNAKEAAVQELDHIIKQIKRENEKLEIERDNLKGLHDDRPEEEKDSLQDLRLMHLDLEKELKDLKDMMIEFMPIPEIKDNTFNLIKNSIEHILQLQLEYEDQFDQLRGILEKPRDMEKEQELLEQKIAEEEEEIKNLELTIEVQEKALLDQGKIENNSLSEYLKKKTLLIEELRKVENLNHDIVNEFKN